MRITLGLRIALRYLFSKKTHNAVNVIAWIAIATTAVAALAIVIILSVFNGFREIARDRHSLLEAPYKMVPADYKAINWEAISFALDSLQIDARYYPLVSTRAFLTSGSGEAITDIRGVDKSWIGRHEVGASIYAGVPYVGDTLGVEWMVTGIGIASRLGVWPGEGEPVRLLAPRSRHRINPASLISSFRTDSAYIAGIFRIDDVETDDNIIFVSIDVARNLAGMPPEDASSVLVYPLENFHEGRLRDFASANNLLVLNLEEQNPSTFRMINIEKWISFSLLAFILIIASLNVVTSLMMLIIEKRDNMSILRAMGLEVNNVKGIFIWEGILLSVFGGILGAALGAVLVIGQKLFGWIKLSSHVDVSLLSIDAYPVSLEFTDFLVVLGLIIILSFIVTAISVSAFSGRYKERI